jgi:hypothetical protein
MQEFLKGHAAHAALPDVLAPPPPDARITAPRSGDAALGTDDTSAPAACAFR